MSGHYGDVLSYWFGEDFTDGLPRHDRNTLWYNADRHIDREIASRFGDDLQRAVRGDYDHWRRTPLGRLALIILLDQFSRHIYRGTSRAFACDPQARSLCLEGIKRRHDRPLLISYRTFFYLPLEHSESLLLQAQSVALYRSMLASAPVAARAELKRCLYFAEQHQMIIARFGRFPHRNAILGRTSTAAEKIYLAMQPPDFGQS